MAEKPSHGKHDVPKHESTVQTGQKPGKKGSRVAEADPTTQRQTGPAQPNQVEEPEQSTEQAKYKSRV